MGPGRPQVYVYKFYCMQLQHAIAAAGRVSQQPDKQIFVQNFTSISVMLMLSQANPGRKLGSDVQNAEINVHNMRGTRKLVGPVCMLHQLLLQLKAMMLVKKKPRPLGPSRMCSQAQPRL